MEKYCRKQREESAAAYPSNCQRKVPLPALCNGRGIICEVAFKLFFVCTLFSVFRGVARGGPGGPDPPPPPGLFRAVTLG